MTTPAKSTAIRAFVRDFNILTKQVSLYGAQHSRATTQADTAWKELATVLSDDQPFRLNVAGDRLLLDGEALKPGPAERAFLSLLSAAGIAGISFHPSATRDEFARFVRAFATAKPTEILENLKRQAASEPSHIRVDELRFVAQSIGGNGNGDAHQASAVASVLGQVLGGPIDLTALLSSPQKLLQVLAATSATPQNGEGQPVTQDEVTAALGYWARLCANDMPRGKPLDQSQLEAAIGELTARLSAEGERDPARSAFLMKVAEHLAIRYALEVYEKSDPKTDAAEQLLDRVRRETTALRQLLLKHEDKLRQAGIEPDSLADVLDRQFWSGVPDASKRKMILSPAAWCIPHRTISALLEPALERDREFVQAALLNYCGFLRSSDPEVHTKVAGGVSALAGMYISVGDPLLTAAVDLTASRLARPDSASLSDQMHRTLVRLAHGACERRQYQAMSQFTRVLEWFSGNRSELAAELRSEVPVEEFLPALLSEAAAVEQVPPALLDVLRATGAPAAEHIARLFGKCTKQAELNQLAAIFAQLGPAAVEHVRNLLRHGSREDVLACVGLLSRLNAAELVTQLRESIGTWNRTQQIETLRQISAVGSLDRALLLVELLPKLDPLVLPLAVELTGVTGDRRAAPQLIEFARGEGAAALSPFLRLKSVEALGRMREPQATALLELIISRKRLLEYESPRELRIAAALALRAIDPARAQRVIGTSGLNSIDFQLAPLTISVGDGWVRRRRYQRVSPRNELLAVLAIPQRRCSLTVERLSLCGGMASTLDRLDSGTEGTLELQMGLRRVRADVVISSTGPCKIAYEILHMDLEDRSRLRSYLTGQLK